MPLPRGGRDEWMILMHALFIQVHWVDNKSTSNRTNLKYSIIVDCCMLLLSYFLRLLSLLSLSLFGRMGAIIRLQQHVRLVKSQNQKILTNEFSLFSRPLFAAWLMEKIIDVILYCAVEALAANLPHYPNQTKFHI